MKPIERITNRRPLDAKQYIRKPSTVYTVKKNKTTTKANDLTNTQLALTIVTTALMILGILIPLLCK